MAMSHESEDKRWNSWVDSKEHQDKVMHWHKGTFALT